MANLRDSTGDRGAERQGGEKEQTEKQQSGPAPRGLRRGAGRRGGSRILLHAHEQVPHRERVNRELSRESNRAGLPSRGTDQQKTSRMVQTQAEFAKGGFAADQMSRPFHTFAVPDCERRESGAFLSP